MALRLYHDSDATEEITEDNPDHVRQAVTDGTDLEEITPIYLASDDDNLTYENITVRKTSTEDNNVYVDYALSESDFDSMAHGDNESIDIDNGAYTSSLTIYRRVVAENVTEPFTRTDIKHETEADEYVA